MHSDWKDFPSPKPECVMRLIPVLLLLAALAACSVHPKSAFDSQKAPPAPDYANPDNWAALPSKKDNADRSPNDSIPDNQANTEVDVFFIHPTTYTGDRGQKLWNAPTTDAALNAKTDNGSILYQASIFNGAGKVYAPRYRQAHLHAYYAKEDSKEDVRQAFELAYLDVKAAFEYYLEHYNQGRPIIIAAHSQGATHGMKLVKAFFDEKPLRDQLVAAYLVGMPVTTNYFKTIKPCERPDETGCFCTWRSYRKDYYPDSKTYAAFIAGITGGVGESAIAVVNPLTWTTDTDYAPNSLNKGGVLRVYNTIMPELADAQVHKDILWVTKPKFPGSFLFNRKNYHIGDFNLFYMNVRENAILRAKAALMRK